MSAQHAVAFLEKAWINETLKESLWKRNSVESIIELAAEEGYTFTMEEFYEVQMDVIDQYDLALDETAFASSAVVIATMVCEGCHCEPPKIL